MEAQQVIEPLPEEPVHFETEMTLISGLLDRKVEQTIAQALDQLCPALEKTPRLQDKALRTVFSVGVDAMLIDAEMSSTMGKLRLTPEDIISPHETQNIFGSFTMPADLRKR